MGAFLLFQRVQWYRSRQRHTWLAAPDGPPDRRSCVAPPAGTCATLPLDSLTPTFRTTWYDSRGCKSCSTKLLSQILMSCCRETGFCALNRILGPSVPPSRPQRYSNSRAPPSQADFVKALKHDRNMHKQQQ